MTGPAGPNLNLTSKRESPPVLTTLKPTPERCGAYTTATVRAAQVSTRISRSRRSTRGRRRASAPTRAPSQFGAAAQGVPLTRLRGSKRGVLAARVRRARADAFDDLGRAPLHDACWLSKPDFALVDALVAAAPAVLFRRDSRGHAPLNFAPRATWELCARFLDRSRVVRAAAPRLRS